MDDTTPLILAKLKDCKQQGLTFYQAKQQLQQQGYTEAQITEAADQFNYTSPVTTSSADSDPISQVANTPLPTISSQNSELNIDYEKMGNDILADKERNTRQYAYVGLSIPAGGLAVQAYRLWLTTKFWGGGGNQHYAPIYNLGYLFLAFVIGAGVAILGLKFYFGAKDRKYKQENERLSNSSDS